MEDVLQIPSRESVYRYILDSIADASDKSELVGIAVLFAYPMLCSPRVSKAITAYLETKHRPAERLTARNEELLKDFSWRALKEQVLLFAKENIKYKRSLPKQYDAIIEAMCWELETTRESFLGS